MKKFEITRHSTRPSGLPMTETECSEASAHLDARGLHILGFDAIGRRWHITIDPALVDDLYRLRRQACAPEV